MEKLIDKIIIFIICAALYIPSENQIYMVVPILVAVITSAILSYLDDERIILGIFVVYSVICFFEPIFLFFIPLICYDVFFLKAKWIGGFVLLPLIISSDQITFSSKWLIAALLAASFVLRHHTLYLQSLKKEYNDLRDNTKEMAIQLEKKNKELIEKQDYEVNLATLKERNRIARDIHDNVGHLLSRSILQVGALLAINKDEVTKEGLTLVKDTLSEAMNTIRNSVHDLHEESIDLHIEVKKLVDAFKFCPIKFDYDVESNLEKSLKYCFIAVTKEALSNIIKHSNATKVSVVIREHPALYQLVIQDNGTNCSCNSENGIGLNNIKDRVAAVGGNVNIGTDKGFRIFISVAKK